MSLSDTENPETGRHVSTIAEYLRVIHRQPETGWRIKSATISQNGDGKYYASVLFEFVRHLFM